LPRRPELIGTALNTAAIRCKMLAICDHIEKE
jgi:hypothetical protein